MNFRGARSKAVQRAAKSLQLLPFGPLVLMLVIRNTQPTKDQRGHAITWDFNMFKGFHPKFEAKPWFRTGTTAFGGSNKCGVFDMMLAVAIYFQFISSWLNLADFLHVSSKLINVLFWGVVSHLKTYFLVIISPNISPIVGMFRHWPTGDEQSKIQHTAERQEADVLSEGVRL